MMWLTWRQFRVQAAAAFALVAGVAIVLAVTGPRLAALSRLDVNLFDRLTRTDRDLFYAGIILMAVAPAVLGAFWGAPLVAKELETGTHRLVWNQSVTRTRWLATKLGLTTLAAGAAVGVLTLAVSWWSDPLDAAVGATRGNLPSRLTPVAFAMRGIAPVGYAVFAVVLGVAIGSVLRRSLPAMALTLAVFTAVQVAVPLWVRPHLISPAHETVTISRATLDSIMADGPGAPVRLTVSSPRRSDWVLSNQTVDASGRVVALPSWMRSCLPPPPSSVATPVRATGSIDGCLSRLTQEGYRQRLVYQPADRFWSLQWAETLLFLALSGLLAGCCFWWTRHRLS